MSTTSPPAPFGRSLCASLLLSLTALSFAMGAQPAPMVTLHGHLSPAVAASRYVGRLASGHVVSLALALPLRNEGELKVALAKMYAPGDPSFHHFLTPSQFTEEYGPSEADYAALADFARAHGLTVIGTHPNRTVLDVAGPSARVEEAFNVRLQQYEKANGRAFFAPDREPSVPAEVAARLTGIVGLDNAAERKSHLRRLAHALSPHQGTGPFGGLAPADVKTAYGLSGLSANGSGQTLAVFELDGYSASDISNYESQFGLRSPSLSTIAVDGVSTTPSGTENQDEVSLDIELEIGMAPSASGIMVYEAPNSSTGSIDAYAQIASDDSAREVSTSWGLPEDQNDPITAAAENVAFEQMAAQGQSIFAASGDNGAYDDSSDSSPTVDDPSSQPFMTGCGGTSLTTNNSEGYVGETVWSDPTSDPPSGSGGGISVAWSKPFYQSGTGAAGNGRCVPDVSLNADPNEGYAIYTRGSWQIFGGTSCCAPQWAGFTALVNQLRGSAGAVGFLNPLLYQIGTGSSYHTDFHDITSGNNLLYSATSGFDEATGWGSFQGAALANALAGLTNNSLGAQVNYPVRNDSYSKVATANGIARGAGLTSVSVGLAQYNAAGTARTGWWDWVNKVWTTTPNTMLTTTATGTAKWSVTMPPAADLVTGTYDLAAVANGTGGSSPVVYNTFHIVPAPPNDNFVNAQLIIGASGSVAGTNVGATLQPGEPEIGGNAGGASVWYKWVATGTGTARFNTEGSSVNFENDLGVYSGTSVSALTLVADAVSNNNDGTSSLSFACTQGVTYYIDVDGYNGWEASIKLSWTAPASPTPSVSIGNAPSVTAPVPGGATVNSVFTVSLSAAASSTVTVVYTTANNTAVAGTDYTATSGTLTFAAGATTKAIDVPVLPTGSTSGNKTFFVNLSSPANAILATSQGTGTIIDATPQYKLSVANASSVQEPIGSASAHATFTVTLSPANTQSVTVRYATANNTATAGRNFTATSGTLTFAAGSTSQTVTVPILDDKTYDPTLTFSLNLSSAVNATITTTQATGTILNSDPLPSFAAGNAPNVNEPAAGSTAGATFTVTLTGATSVVATVHYATANSTAIAGKDYTAESGTLTFAVGQTSETVTVPITSDSAATGNLTFFLNLSAAANASIATAQGTGTIVVGPALSIANSLAYVKPVSGTENSSFTVTLSPASTQTVTVHYATANGTAIAGTAYTAESGTLTFTAGQTSKSIAVPILANSTVSGTQTFTVNLSAAVNAAIVKAQGTGTILDYHPAITAHNANSVTEPASGTASASFSVTLSKAYTSAVTVHYATANNTAIAGKNYTATSGTLTFPAGTTSLPVSVPILNDKIYDATSTFFLNLSSATNATIAAAQATGLILNSDPAPALAVDNAAAVEQPAAGGSANAVFTVTLTGATSLTTTVHYATANSSAVAGRDYTSESGTLTFTAGQTSKTVSVPILNDSANSGTTTFFLNLSTPVDATVSHAQGTGTITPRPGSAPEISGAWTWQSEWDTNNGWTVALQAAKITNAGTVASGTLQLQLWTSSSLYAGGALTGTEMAAATIGTLAAGASLTNVARTVVYTPPPAGTAYAVLVLAEYNGSSYVVRSYSNASAATDFTAPGAVLFGTWAWQSFVSDADGNQVTIDCQYVANTNVTAATNNLQLELWALKTPYNGSGDATGYQLAVLPLDPLPAQTYYQDIQETVNYTPPPSGTYYVTLFLTEQEGTQYTIQDYLAPSGSTAFAVKSGSTSAAATGLSNASVNAAQGTIGLAFTGRLDASSAIDLAHYALSIDGQPGEPASAAYNPATNTVILTAPGLSRGDKVIASWHGLLDAHGNPLNGQTATLGVP